MSNLQQRLIVGGITSVFAILILWFSPYPFFRPIFAFLMASLITLAAWELFQLAKHKGYTPLVGIGLVSSFLYPLGVFISTQFALADILPYIVLILSLFACLCTFLKKGQNPLINTALTLLALTYIAIPLSSWLNIAYYFSNQDFQEGRWWLFYLLAVTKVTDMGAYFIGSLCGRHKLAPYLSPGKSWEGALGGLFFGLLTSLGFYLATPRVPIELTLLQSLGLGFVLSSMGQMGDLAESLFKRDAGVKNSSQIPGLGGILDMLDSLVFTSPIVYIFLKIQFLFS